MPLEALSGRADSVLVGDTGAVARAGERKAVAETGERQLLRSPSCELMLSLLELRLDRDSWSALLARSGVSIDGLTGRGLAAALELLGVGLVTADGRGATFMT